MISIIAFILAFVALAGGSIGRGMFSLILLMMGCPVFALVIALCGILSRKKTSGKSKA